MVRLNDYPVSEYNGYFWEDEKGNLAMGSKNNPEFGITEKKEDDIIKRQLRAANYLSSKKRIL
jgi:hypothetical protein